jgi:trigger factor
MVPTKKLNAAAIADFVGKKVGDVISFDLSKAFDAHQIQHLTGLSKEESANVSGTYTLTVSNMNRQVLAEYSSDFYKKVFTDFSEEGTHEEFVERVKEEMGKAYVAENRNYFNAALEKALLATTKIDLPESILFRWLQSNNDKLSAQEILQHLPSYLKDLRWTLLRDRLLEEQLGVGFSMELVEEYVAQKNLSMLAQYGMPTDSEETLAMAKQLAKRYLTEEKGKNVNQMTRETYDFLFFDRASQLVANNIKEVSLNEFQEHFHMLTEH